MKKSRRSWLPAVIWSVAVLTGLVILLKTNETAREVVGGAALSIFQIFTSPFVLEATLAVLGLCTVIAINHYRQQKEGDGWVYLEQTKPAPDPIASDDPPHRHDAVVWQEKPEAFDDASTELDVVEGYLDLGLAEDALRELSSLPTGLRGETKVAALTIRALAMSGRRDEAYSTLDTAKGHHPEQSRPLAEAALSIALWLHENKKPAGEIDEWLQRCLQLDESVLDRLAAGHPLRTRGAN